MMSDDYGHLAELLDAGNMVVCFIDYEYRTGDRTIVFRDVAKARSNDYAPSSHNYGYTVEARGIVYLSWDRRMLELRGVTFAGMCEELRLQFIENH